MLRAPEKFLAYGLATIVQSVNFFKVYKYTFRLQNKAFLKNYHTLIPCCPNLCDYMQ